MAATGLRKAVAEAFVGPASLRVVAERLGMVPLGETVTALRTRAFRLGGTTCVMMRAALSLGEFVELTHRRGSGHSLAH